MSTAVIGLIFGLSSCGNETSNEKKEVKEIEKEVKEISLKIGDKHEGGYIFFLDFEGKHGKICAPRFEGDEKVVNIEDAFNLAEKLELNGFSNWRLPSNDELLMILNLKRNDLFGFSCGEDYWTNEEDKRMDGWFWILRVSSDCEASVNFSGDYNTRYKVVRDF
jgi:hypothetical protein